MKKRSAILLISLLTLTFFGLLMIYDASSYVSLKDFGDKYHFIKDQIFWTFIGFGALAFFYLFDYKKLYNLALPILLVAILFLSLVFVPGLGIELLGANRWVDFGFFTVQSSEFAKLALVIYLSAWFSGKEKGRLPAFVLLLGLVVGLILAEPDMGTGIIVLILALSMYFLSNAPFKQFFAILPVFAVVGLIFTKLEPYRAQRLATFLNFNQDPQTSSYHVRQILIALGSGGLTGVGIGNSLQKYAYLPENTTDSIFAIIAEEVGLIGSLFVIGFYILIVAYGFQIASKAKDNFGRLLASGIVILVGVQTLINLASQTALIPLTGVPLPFVSYGGSALIVNMSAVGILLNISKQSK